MENVPTPGQVLEEDIRRANTIIVRRGRSVLSEMGISNSQFNALLALKDYGSLTMGDLCRHLNTACSTATDLADRLERENLVERMRDIKDRRIVRMHLLPKGEQIVQTVMADRHSFLEKVLEDYSAEENAALLKTIAGLADRMENMDTVYPAE